MSLLTTAKSALEVLEMLGEGALVEKLRAAVDRMVMPPQQISE